MEKSNLMIVAFVQDANTIKIGLIGNCYLNGKKLLPRINFTCNIDISLTFYLEREKASAPFLRVRILPFQMTAAHQF